jgi:S1-C subfamily serine protease
VNVKNSILWQIGYRVAALAFFVGVASGAVWLSVEATKKQHTWMGSVQIQPSLKMDVALKQTWMISRDTRRGTGVAVKLADARVVVLTAEHVVQGVDAVILVREERTSSGAVAVRMVKAKVLKSWPEWDVAVLVPEFPEWVSESAILAKDSHAPLGSRLIHVGCLLGTGFPHSITQGVVSNWNVKPGERYCPGWPWAHPLDLTDAGIMPGSSGGPLFNDAGEVVGIVVGSAGHPLSVFVPARDIKPLLDGIRKVSH